MGKRPLFQSATTFKMWLYVIILQLKISSKNVNCSVKTLRFEEKNWIFFITCPWVMKRKNIFAKCWGGHNFHKKCWIQLSWRPFAVTNLWNGLTHLHLITGCNFVKKEIWHIQVWKVPLPNAILHNRAYHFWTLHMQIINWYSCLYDY